jgi:hypothetical protein
MMDARTYALKHRIPRHGSVGVRKERRVPYVEIIFNFNHRVATYKKVEVNGAPPILGDFRKEPKIRTVLVSGGNTRDTTGSCGIGPIFPFRSTSYHSFKKLGIPKHLKYRMLTSWLVHPTSKYRGSRGGPNASSISSIGHLNSLRGFKSA